MFKWDHFVMMLLVDIVSNQNIVNNNNLTCGEYAANDYNNNSVTKTLCIEVWRANISVDNAVQYCRKKSMILLDLKDTSRTTLLLKMLEKHFADDVYNSIEIPLNAKRTKQLDSKSHRATVLKVNDVNSNNILEIEYVPMDKNQELPALCKKKEWFWKSCYWNDKCYVIKPNQNLFNPISECDLLNEMPSKELLKSGLFQNQQTYWIGEKLYTWVWNVEDEEFPKTPLWELGHVEDETTECLYVVYDFNNRNLTWRATGCANEDSKTKTIVCCIETMITKMTSDPLINTSPPSSSTSLSTSTTIKLLIILSIVVSLLILAVGLAVVIYRKKHRKTKSNVIMMEEKSGYAFVLPFKSKILFKKSPKVRPLNYVDLNLLNHETKTENCYSVINDDEIGRVCVYSTIDDVQMNDSSQLVVTNSDLTKKITSAGKKKRVKNLKIIKNIKVSSTNPDHVTPSPTCQFEILTPTSPITFCTNDLYNINNEIIKKDDKVVLNQEENVIYSNINQHDNVDDKTQQKNPEKSSVKTFKSDEKLKDGTSPVQCDQTFVSTCGSVYYKMSSPIKTSPSEIVYESASPSFNNNIQQQLIYDNNSQQQHQPPQLANNNQVSFDIESTMVDSSQVYSLEKQLV